MKQHYKTIIAIVCAVAAIVFFFRSCRSDSMYRAMKQQYEGYRAIAEADHKMSMDRIEELTKEIGDRDKEIGQLERTILQKSATIRELSTRLDELQNAEPSQPELEKEPLVINLRAQIAKLTEMFALSQGVVEEQRKVIVEWEGKFVAQEKISAEWKQAYEREHALRLSCEGLNKQLEKSYRISLLKGKVVTVAAVAIGGGLIYSLLK